MRTDFEEPRAVDAYRSKTTRRRRSLGRGIDRWVKSTTASWRSPRHQVWLLLLTYDTKRGPWDELAQLQPTSDGSKLRRQPQFLGRIRDFWEAVRAASARAGSGTAPADRDRTRRNRGLCRPPRGAPRARVDSPGTPGSPLTYFAWLELTAQGFPHYHVILVDPPFRWNRRTKAWLERIWGLGFVKRKVRDAAWFHQKGAAYVGSYAKKFGDKDYQQNYDEVPREIRTFTCNRLEHQVDELRQHEDRWIAHFRPEHYDHATREHVAEQIVLEAVERHFCGRHGLRYVTKLDALRRRTRRPALRTANLSTAGPIRPEFTRVRSSVQTRADRR